MFSSNSNLLLKETQLNKLSEGKQMSSVEKFKVLNQNNDDNITNIVIEPNRDIPKTVYYKRMCQKLDQQNNAIELKNNKLKLIENSNTIIIDKIIQDKNEELCNDNNNTLKEIVNPLKSNDFKENLDSTLVICESDVTPSESDCELNTTPVIQCGNSVKGKENISLESFFSKLKQPIKLKKKMVISPATIGVKNSPNAILKNGEELNKSRNLDSNIKVQRKVNNSSENKVIKSSNNITQSVFSKEHSTKFDSKTDVKPLSTTDIIYNRKSSTSENNQIPSINSEATIGVQNIPNTILKYGEELNRSRNLNSNRITQSVFTKEHSTKLDSKIDVKPFSSTDIIYNKKSSTSKNNNQIPSINIEVEQVPSKRKIVVKEINIDNIEPIKVRKSARVTRLSSSVDNDINMPIKNVKYLSMNHEKKSSPPKQEINQLEYNLSTNCHINNLKTLPQSVDSIRIPSKYTAVEAKHNETCTPSISIEVEQGSIFKHSNTRKVIMRSSSENKQEIKKGRRVQLITIKDHYSQPLPSFNGAKKTEIDVSKKSVHTEKVVESSSHFFVPQLLKRRRVMHFSNADL